MLQRGRRGSGAGRTATRDAGSSSLLGETPLALVPDGAAARSEYDGHPGGRGS